VWLGKGQGMAALSKLSLVGRRFFPWSVRARACMRRELCPIPWGRITPSGPCTD
jgi:hypothetical protein